jgi:hypothetical protein
MIYAAEEPERSASRRSQMAEICANHKNLRHLRHLCAKKNKSQLLNRAEYNAAVRPDDELVSR